MPIGRPREFDVETALELATALFWRKGYEGTSLSDLTETLGITRSSFYNAFGTREDLFREALADYLALLPKLPEAGKPEQAILPQLTGFFRALCAFHAKSGWHGCMIANCVAELCSPTGELDKELTLCVRRSVERFQSILDAAKPFEVEIDGTKVTCTPSLRKQEPWPAIS